MPVFPRIVIVALTRVVRTSPLVQVQVCLTISYQVSAMFVNLYATSLNVKEKVESDNLPIKLIITSHKT